MRTPRFFLQVIVILIGSLFISSAQEKETTKKGTKMTSDESKSKEIVVLETSMGKIEVAMFRAEAPKTVENFLSYVRDKFYDSTIFHRVIKNFMIQGGGFTKDLKQKSTKPSIVNEADNGLKNEVGTIAMARTPDPNSATSQFFINVKDNSSLNFKNKTPQGWGYCVFGRVVKGMDVVNKIENVKTGSANGMQDVPVEPVVILTVRQKGKNEPAPK